MLVIFKIRIDIKQLHIYQVYTIYSRIWKKWGVCPSSSSSIQFWSGFIPVNEGGWIYPSNLSHSHSPSHLIHGILFFHTNTLALLLHLRSPCLNSLGRPRFLFPFTSNSNAFLKTWHHPTLTLARTISLHSPLPSQPLFPSIPTSPLGLLSSFSASVLHHTLLSPSLSQFFSKLPSHSPYALKKCGGFSKSVGDYKVMQ